jgi:HSP20 family protein
MNTLVKNNLIGRKFVPGVYTDLLDSFFNNSFFDNAKGGFAPAASVAEDEKAYYVTLDIPGANKEDIKLELNDGILSVSGEKKFQKEENTKKYHIVESSYGSFKRSFRLPDNIKAEAIEAAYKDGVLAITVPKEEGKVLKSTIEVK